MSQITKEIVDKLKLITLLEAAELVSEIEEVFGVDAKASTGRIIIMPTAGAQSTGQPVSEDKTTFDVILESVAENSRVAALKAVRSLTNLGLKEAKDFCSSLPKTVKSGVSKEEATDAKKELEGAGGTVAVK